MSAVVLKANNIQRLISVNDDNTTILDDDVDNGIRHIAKRPRYLAEWEQRLHHAISTSCTQHCSLGLSNLFGDSGSMPDRDTLKGASSIDTLLRLEHREGGPLSRYPGEERILLFQSNRPGAIAKIIYSCQPAVKKHNDERDSNRNVPNERFHARVHVLDVKASYRGLDLGSLLFTEAMTSLRKHYLKRRDFDSSSTCSTALPSIYCELEAEEDTRRHNKLVRFYERLGCSTKPKAKILYINNNDGETYRKIPMRIEIAAHDCEVDKKYPKASVTMGVEDFPQWQDLCFLPALLCTASGNPVGLLHKAHPLHWILVEDSQHRIELRTTTGFSLLASPEGDCSLVKTLSRDQLDWFKFRLIRISDQDQGRILTLDDEADTRDFRILQSCAHGTFLSLRSNNMKLYCRRRPSFWKVDPATHSLTFSEDTPPRRQHYRKHWMTQCVQYVEEMKKRYSTFRITEMSLQAALNLAACLPAHPFEINMNNPSVSLRTRCFRAAEYCRQAGHPDWVQLVVLVYGLGSIVNCIDIRSGMESENGYDWTIASRSRVVGCYIPNSVQFSEFHFLNPEATVAKYNNELGIYLPHCGLSNVLLTWTGPEYMYHMLQHNNVSIPEEGLKMLRLASLSDWHTNNMYNRLADDDDFDMQSFIADFDELMLAAEALILDGDEVTSEECDRLWSSHYEDIASKYNLDGDLKW